ncbi:uncharacterized protein LOC105215695 [Zeugodacus cucurbitae]|uniref:uncharacterized protein LOC105215695 n=1 Tax=Zeugodacus cucurbitae TaxID=28588 RepID=UPI0023D9017A|nr:uncharacterized protein LOC105215695 [Zeugodacus cucurbitae]
MLRRHFIIGLNIFTLIMAERVFMRDRPPFFKQCTADMSDYEDCYKSNLQSMLVEYQDGIPGLPKADTFEPVRIRRIRIEQDELSLRLTNLTIHGISATNITKIRHDPNDYSFRTRVLLPELRISADFRAHGRLLFLPIDNSGKLTLETMAVKLSFLFALQLEDEGNQTFANPQAVQSKIVEIGDFHLRLENFLAGNTELEGTINELLNELWRDVIEILRPTLENAINAVTLTRFKSVLNFIPANYFISDVPSAAEFYANVIDK